MKTLIAVKAFGRTPPGGSFRLNDRDARVVVALGLAAYAPPPKPKAEPKPKAATPKPYLRRDMVAAPVPQTVVSGYAYPLKTPDDGKAKE